MATEERTTGTGLVELDLLLRRARSSSFFTLMALLERHTPGAQRVGGDGPPMSERIRLRHDPSMAFPTGDVSACDVRNREQILRAVAEDRPAPEPIFELTTTFLGLSGSASPLPLYLSAEVAQEEVTGGLRRPFLDVFHHRVLSLFYRAWSRYSLTREAACDGADPWARRLQALAGHDAYLGATGSLTTGERLALLPVLAGQARTAEGLALVLSRVLQANGARITVQIEQFQGGSISIDPRLQMALSRETAVLGRSAVLGSRLNDPANGFRIRLEHVPERRSSDFLPGGRAYQRISAVVRDFVREPLDYDLHLQFDGSNNGRGFALSATRGVPLGGQTFLQGRAESRDIIVPGPRS